MPRQIYTAKREGNYVHGVIFIYVRFSVSRFMLREKSSFDG